MWKEICLGTADDMRRLAARVNISNRPQHHTSGGDNRLIGRNQKLLLAVYDRTAALNDRGILNVEDSPHPGEAPALHRFAILQIAVSLLRIGLWSEVSSSRISWFLWMSFSSIGALRRKTMS